MELLGVLETLTDEQLAPPYGEAKMWLGLDEGEPLPEALERLVSEFLTRRQGLREDSPTAPASAAALGNAESAGAPAASGRADAGCEEALGKSGADRQWKPK